MSNVKHMYNVVNNMDEFIIKITGERMASNGERVTKKEIYHEVANYCGVGWENIRRINRNVSQPSLAVALKISNYFKVPVEDIFKISPQEVS